MPKPVPHKKPTPPTPPPAKIAPARKFAYDALMKLGAQDSHFHSDDLLRSRIFQKLSAPDRNLASALVLGVLRWQLALDAEIRSLLAKPNARLDGEVLLALRLGAFQLLHLDRIPAHAAINESVELTRIAHHRFATGMVNAVLRKIAANKNTSASLAAYPAWMVERWTANFGETATRNICEHSQHQPQLAVRIPSTALKNNTPTQHNDSVQFEPGQILSSAQILTGAFDADNDSLLRIQDEGSQLIAEIAAALAPSALTVLDCCAAPGGKTLTMADCLPKANFLALDSNATRLEALKRRIESEKSSTQARIDCQQHDATLPLTTSNSKSQCFDLVLADLPCSGTGTLGRNPEIRHRLTADEIQRQAERQQKILANVLNALKPGARLIYSTCSLEPEENQHVIDAVLADSAANSPNTFRQLNLLPAIDWLDTRQRLVKDAQASLQQALTPSGALLLLPGTLGTDGFFIAAIERV